MAVSVASLRYLRFKAHAVVKVRRERMFHKPVKCKILLWRTVPKKVGTVVTAHFKLVFAPITVTSVTTIPLIDRARLLSLKQLGGP